MDGNVNMSINMQGRDMHSGGMHSNVSMNSNMGMGMGTGVQMNVNSGSGVHMNMNVPSPNMNVHVNTNVPQPPMMHVHMNTPTVYTPTVYVEQQQMPQQQVIVTSTAAPFDIFCGQAIPDIDPTMGLVILILNICISGLGTMLVACVGRGEVNAVTWIVIGFAQLCLLFVFVGWVWSIYVGLLVYRHSIQPKVAVALLTTEQQK